jgi:hypothetical protein
MFQPLCYNFTKFNWQVIELATIGLNRVCDVGAITKDTWTINNIEGIMDGMVSKFEGDSKLNLNEPITKWFGLHGSGPHHCLSIEISPKCKKYRCC